MRLRSGRAGPAASQAASPATGPAGARSTNLRVLVVEDEVAIAAGIRQALTDDGHAVDVVGDGLEALTWAETYPYDLAILDVILPGLDGFAVCGRLRSAGFPSPILILTALDGVDDRVQGLDQGADDYLAKPFAMAELRARVRALRRRIGPDRAATITIGDLELDPATLSVSRAGRPIRLTGREFALLELLARHPGQLYTQDRLLDALWDADFVAESNIVEVYIRSLRRKIDENDARMTALKHLLRARHDEVVRINAGYDVELEELRRLWAPATRR